MITNENVRKPYHSWLSDIFCNRSAMRVIGELAGMNESMGINVSYDE